MFDLKHEDVWYRISLHINGDEDRYEVFTDWRLRFHDSVAVGEGPTVMGPLGGGRGIGYWDQIVVYQVDPNKFQLSQPAPTNADDG